MPAKTRVVKTPQKKDPNISDFFQSDCTPIEDLLKDKRGVFLRTDPFRLEKFTISSMVKKPNEVGDGFTEESTNCNAPISQTLNN